MGSRQDVHVTAAHAIHKAEREPRKHVSSGTPMTRPGERIARDGVDRVVQLIAKGIGHADVPSGVPLRVTSHGAGEAEAVVGVAEGGGQ